MAVNPFGDSSDSVHAWREKYRQMEFEANSLRQALTEVRTQFNEISENSSQLKEINETLNNQVSELKQELLAVKQISRERAEKIDALDRQLDVNQIEKLLEENSILKSKIDDLSMQYARGGGEAKSVDNRANSSSGSERIFNALIPVILNEYDPENKQYKDGFKNMVEVAITDGDILTQIIAILFKYGGNGPVNRIKDMVSDKSAFDTALELLLEQKILTKSHNEIYLYSQSEDLSIASNWNTLTSDELVDLLAKVISKGSNDAVETAIDNFRDELTERGTSTATLFFQIRKLKEGITKGEISRPEALKTLEEWRSKI